MSFKFGTDFLKVYTLIIFANKLILLAYALFCHKYWTTEQK